MSRNILFIILISCILISTTGYSQFRNWDRFELGGNYIMAMGNFSGVSTVTDQYGNFAGDTTVKKRGITSSVGYGAFIGTCIPFKKLGHESLWAVSLGFNANMITWSNVNEVYNASGSLVPNSMPGVGPASATTMQFSLPFGIEWKVGTDAIKTQRKHLGASFGVGMMPIMNQTTMTGVQSYDEHGSGFNFGFNPYFKAEASFYTRICWKLRMTASYGKLNYMFENNNVGSLTDGPFRIQGVMSITGTLIVMPFSGHWTEYSWFNTYDTYNPWDRLH